MSHWNTMSAWMKTGRKNNTTTWIAGFAVIPQNALLPKPFKRMLRILLAFLTRLNLRVQAPDVVSH
jgi:hypothetical protein